MIRAPIGSYEYWNEWIEKDHSWLKDVGKKTFVTIRESDL